MNSDGVTNYSDVLALSSLFQDSGKYGSVTKDYEALLAQRRQLMNKLQALQNSYVSSPCSNAQTLPLNLSNDVIDLDSDETEKAEDKTNAVSNAIILVDSDEEDDPHRNQNVLPLSSHQYLNFQESMKAQLEQKLLNRSSTGEGKSIIEVGNNAISVELKRLPPSVQYEKVVLKNVNNGELAPSYSKNQTLEGIGGVDMASVLNMYKTPKTGVRGRKRKELPMSNGSHHPNVKKESTENFPPVPFEDNQEDTLTVEIKEDTKVPENDGLDDLWNDMSVAIEVSKEAESSLVPEEEDEEDCNHSFMLQDDFGLVCRVCGVIQKKIDSIFDYQWSKGNRSIRTYMPASRNSNSVDIGENPITNMTEHFFDAAEISIHPRHMKQMKPHQVEGFNFLVKNLLGDPPGGCILAHAPGSGKTFMLISFIQSFMAKYYNARPLVVLPKGILAIWKREFERWQVEDIPLYDFYSVKADSRAQQLDVLNKWQNNRSILLLGYKQFANIICEGGQNPATLACQDKLLKIPTLLILDEGHTPRNDNTDMVGSLTKVQTPCKVVLSGTLFQNHVDEVFSILKLVRPNFMKMEHSRVIMKRIMSFMHIPGGKRATEAAFCELVEETLRNDENYKRKISVIKELRSMTRDVLHYYKGDFLEELPGLIDFTVLLNLGSKQKEAVRKLGKLDKFKRSSMEKIIYIHPTLINLKDNALNEKSINVDKVDQIIKTLNISDGAKAKFFLTLLTMCEAANEKLLVFSQYLLPLKFLERLIVELKGWRLGKEIFAISGDSSAEDREVSMDQFNNSQDAKLFFGSIKACGEGISLVGASRILILDVHLNPSVTRQAIGRAFRPGQLKKVYTYRLVAADSQEEDDHKTAFRKELISKMWFEWNEHFGQRDLEMNASAISIEESEDRFFENHNLGEDVKFLYKRSL